MKIAIWHNLPSGGGKRALYDHVRGLVGHGHTVESWCPPTASQTYLPLSEIITEHIVPLASPARIVHGPAARILARYHDIPERIAAMDQHCRLCADAINKGNFDILFANACTFFRVTAIGRYVNIPKVIYLQEPYRWLYEALPNLPWAALPKREMGKWSGQYIKNSINDFMHVQGLRVQVREETRNAEAFDTILVNSYFSRESVLRAYGLNASVCYLGIDTNLFSASNQPQDNFVVGLGAIYPEKNPKLVIEALACIKGPRPRLIWIGNVANPIYLEELMKLAHSLDVCFEPMVNITDEEVTGLLGRAIMMVYAPRLEPFGYAPLEANACGTPVVAVAEGGTRETVINGVNGLFAEHKPQSIARAIQQLLTDREQALKLGQNGQRLVAENWSMASAIDRLENRFMDVIGR